MSEITRILDSLPADQPAAAERPLPLVYDELRRLAAHRLAHELPDKVKQREQIEAWKKEILEGKIPTDRKW